MPRHRHRRTDEGERLCRGALRRPSAASSGFAFGIGAIGEAFSDCRDRFGEFVAVGGAAAYQPSDGTNVPDYLVGSGAHTSELQVLYCLAGEGSFAGSFALLPTRPAR